MHVIPGTNRVCLMACAQVPLEQAIGALPWRTGRTIGRTVYDGGDRLIGTLDSPELAARAVDAVNGERHGVDADALLERVLAAIDADDEDPIALLADIRKHLGK